MTSKIDICSNALQLVGDNPISSFTESDSAALAENLYDQFYESQLSYHPWGFALKQQKLNLLTEKPDTMTNYSHAFQLPTDLVFLWNIQPYSSYEIIGDLLYSNSNQLLATYTHKVSESQLPSYFVTMMQYKMASEFAQTVTENGGLAQLYEQKYRMELGAAQAIDSKQRPQMGILDQPYLQVRNY